MLPPGFQGQDVAQQKVGQAAVWMAGWLTATLGMTIAGRQLAQEVSVFEVMLLRSGIATLILVPIIMLNGGLKGRFSQVKIHAARNVVHYVGQYAWFSALLMIPLAEVIAIEFTMPLWIAILAVAFLGERLYGYKVAALIVGFGGVLMIVRPGLTLNAGHLVALVAAVLFAISVTLTKYITRRDSALTVIFFMFTMQSAMGAVPAWLTWIWPSPHNWPWVAVVALAGASSHFCLSKAISLADATVVMPMDFLRLPLSALAGYLIYSEGLDMWSLAGGAMILAANTINIVKASRA